MQDKTPAIIAMLSVLVLIYLSNSGKLSQLMAIIHAAPTASPPAASGSGTGPTTPAPGTMDPGGTAGGGTPGGGTIH
jgi:hypothetical protein